MTNSASTPPMHEGNRSAPEPNIASSFNTGEMTPVRRNSSPYSGPSNSSGGKNEEEFEDATSVFSNSTAVASNVQNPKPSTAKFTNSSPSPNSLRESKLTLASSPATRRMLRNRAKEKSRDRVAGGAAAKLLGPDVSPAVSKNDSASEAPLTEETVAEDGDEDFKFGDEKINQLREKAKEEWKRGKEDNKRYMPTPPHLEEDDEESPLAIKKKKERPSALNRQDIFHENANASVFALLSPAKTPTANSLAGSALDDSIVSRDNVLKPTQHSAFRPPECDDASSAAGSVASSSVLSGKGSFSHAGPVVLDTTYNSRRPTTKALISSETERKIEILKERMLDPSETLADLLTAICSPMDGSDMDRGYMVRRKNACGALKVLTSKPGNRKTICWTAGVLPALTSVLDDSGEEGINATFPDAATRHEYVEARKRAVTNLLNLTMPKDNRFAVFHSVGLVKALLKTINEDEGESRQGCCVILAYLARTAENRLLMVHIPDLINTLTRVIDPDAQKTKNDEVHEFLSSARASLESSAASDSDCEEDKMDSMMTDDTGTDEAYTSPGTDFEYSSVEQAKDASMDSDDSPPTSPSSRKAVHAYDKHPNEFLNGARQYVFATLTHLVKEKENAFHLARHEYLISALVAVSKFQEGGSHKHALSILANLTRHRDNSKWLMFRLPDVVAAFVTATTSPDDKSRKYACYGLQNMSQEKACRQEMGVTSHLLPALCHRARRATDKDEKLAAISALKNLTDEPANLVPMTNAPDCLATFMQIARGRNDKISEMMQYRACDGLATLSHWLRKIATSGQIVKDDGERLSPRKRELFVPTLKVVTWDQWE